jgi:hypothetical protein
MPALPRLPACSCTQMRLLATPAVLRKLQAGRGFRVFGRFREDAYGAGGCRFEPCGAYFFELSKKAVDF